jgi:hypothetical protein
MIVRHTLRMILVVMAMVGSLPALAQGVPGGVERGSRGAIVQLVLSAPLLVAS